MSSPVIISCIFTAAIWKERGKLLNNTVVTTVMSNFGLYKAFDEQGIGLCQDAVGDKYVYEYMVKNDCRIGGEQSGHIIFSSMPAPAMVS